ncbi:MAG: transcription elongation factor GreA [Mycoplasma sp.]|nr:transcription elongation factor GreA [Mycoplasma sp.]
MSKKINTQQEHFLTKEGKNKLIEELNYLVSEIRPKVIQEIKDARLLGDLSENAEYDAAREKQAKIEDRIRELQIILENTVVANVSKTKTVKIGSTIEIEKVETKEKLIFQIVGVLEVDPLAKPIAKISNDSILAKSILNKEEGQIVEVRAKNVYKVKIVKIN